MAEKSAAGIGCPNGLVADLVLQAIRKVVGIGKHALVSTIEQRFSKTNILSRLHGDRLALALKESPGRAAVKKFTRGRLVHEPGENVVSLLQAGQDTPGRETADEGLGTINRVDDPVDIH